MKVSHRVLSFAAGLFLLVGCGGNSNNTQSIGTISCSASATVVSGNVSQASTAVQVSSILVNILNGSAGPYTLSIPGLGTVTSASTTYSYPGSVSMTTTSAGGISNSISVVDSSNGNSGSCLLSIPGSSTGGTTSGSLTANVTTAVVGSTIVLTATNSTSSAPWIFTFVPQTLPSPITLQQTSNNTANVTGLTAGTYTINAYQSGSTVAPSTISLTFTASTGTGTTGSLTCQLYASATRRVGIPVQLVIASSTGETVIVSAGSSSGEGSPTTADLVAPLQVTYGIPGTKVITLYARGTSGALCNGTGVLQGSLQITY